MPQQTELAADTELCAAALCISAFFSAAPEVLYRSCSARLCRVVSPMGMPRVRYEHDRYKAGFWRRVADASITLISDNEAGQSVGTSTQAAADFLAQHSAQRQVQISVCAWVTC